MFKYKRWPRLKAIAKSMEKGASLTAACEAAKISRDTIRRWRKESPEINVFIEKLIDGQIQVVEDALYKRATGYTFEETTKEQEQSASEKKIIKIVKKEVMPDTTAIMFFLMNRAPDKWVDKRALIQNTNIIKNTVNPISRLSEEELDGIIAGITQER